LLLIHLSHVIERFPEVAELATLQRDCQADRVGVKPGVFDSE
jgi:hypothetical protein